MLDFVARVVSIRTCHYVLRCKHEHIDNRQRGGEQQRRREKELDGGAGSEVTELVGERAVVLTIYMRKSKSPLGKSNGLHHSVWEASENMGCDLR